MTTPKKATPNGDQVMIPIATPLPIDLTDTERSIIDTYLEGTYDAANTGEGNPANAEWNSAVEGIWAALHDRSPALTPSQARILVEIIEGYEGDDEGALGVPIARIAAVANRVIGG